MFSNTPAINWLSAARFFLFGSRDVWFVVALPVYLYEVLNWNFTKVGSFMALWIIGYGIVQALTPKMLGSLKQHKHAPNGFTAQMLALLLALIPAGIALGLMQGVDPTVIIVAGLLIFGAVFAINSAVHSYLILDYADHDKVALNVGFYYMANAAGRLAGTVLSGLVYQGYGLIGCLWVSAGFVLMAGVLSSALPKADTSKML